MSRPGVLAAGLGVMLPLALLTGCADQADRYCDAVADNQDRLTEIAGSGDAVALFEARDVYRDLEQDAPSDIAGDWQLVVARIDALETAIGDAGVDPASYDPDEPPEGLGDRERARIEQAADDLVALDTVRAMRDVEQQALDVCGTPLRL